MTETDFETKLVESCGIQFHPSSIFGCLVTEGSGYWNTPPRLFTCTTFLLQMFAPVRRKKVGKSCPYYSKVLDSLREWLPLEWCLGKAMQSSERNKDIFKSTKKLRLHERRALLRSLTFVFSRQQDHNAIGFNFSCQNHLNRKIENEAFLANAASCFAFHKALAHLEYRSLRSTGSWNIVQLFATILPAAMAMVLWCLMMSYVFANL